MLLTLFLQGATIGLSAAGTPGPLQAFLVSESLAGGWRRGAPVTLAPLLTDLPIIVLMVGILGRMPAFILQLIGIAGGLFVWYLAWQLWQDWRKGVTVDPNTAPTGGIRKAMVMNFLSPGPYIFWGLVSGPVLVEAWQTSAFNAIAFLLGFYGLFIGGMLLLVGIFNQTRRLGEQLVRWLMLVSVVLLVVFGGLLLWNGFVG
jgi:threonine/homoserine/homoserine lactone efflux protein